MHNIQAKATTPTYRSLQLDILQGVRLFLLQRLGSSSACQNCYEERYHIKIMSNRTQKSFSQTGTKRNHSSFLPDTTRLNHPTPPPTTSLHISSAR